MKFQDRSLCRHTVLQGLGIGVRLFSAKFHSVWFEVYCNGRRVTGYGGLYAHKHTIYIHGVSCGPYEGYGAIVASLITTKIIRFVINIIFFVFLEDRYQVYYLKCVFFFFGRHVTGLEKRR